MDVWMDGWMDGRTGRSREEDEEEEYYWPTGLPEARLPVWDGRRQKFLCKPSKRADMDAEVTAALTVTQIPRSPVGRKSSVRNPLTTAQAVVDMSLSRP